MGFPVGYFLEDDWISTTVDWRYPGSNVCQEVPQAHGAPIKIHTNFHVTAKSFVEARLQKIRIGFDGGPTRGRFLGAPVI